MQQSLDSTRQSLAHAFDALADNARRQQHLYSVTIALLIAVVLFSGVLLAYLAAGNHLENRRDQLSHYRATIAQQLQGESSFLRRSVLTVRYFRDTLPVRAFDEKTIRTFRQSGVASVTLSALGANCHLLATAATRQAWGPKLAIELTRLRQIALGAAATRQAFGLNHRAYAISLEDDSGVVLTDAGEPGSVETTFEPGLIAVLRDALTQALLDRSGHAVPPRDREIWVGPMLDPLTNATVMIGVSAAYSGDLPTMLVAASIPARDFLARLERPGEPALLALLNAANEAIDILPSSAQVTDAVKSDVLAQAAHLSPATPHYLGSGVLLVHPLRPGFGSLVYFLPYRLLATALAPELAVIVGAGLLLIIAIVLTARYWDRHLLRRIHDDASRALENEVLKQILVSATPIGLCIVRQRDHTVLTSNELAQTLLHLDRDGALPATVTEAFQRQPHGSGQLASIAHFTVPAPDHPAELESGQPHVAEDLPPQRFLQITYAPARHQDDDVLFCAVQDCTAQLALEQQLRSAQQATEAMMRARSSFFAAMSHEIRTPLNALAGNLELLARSPGMDAHVPRLKALDAAMEGLRRIVNDILDFSKIDAGKMELVCEPFRLIDALESLALTYAPMAGGRPIRFHLHLSPTLDVEVHGDRVRLIQVVNNLLNNAFKFTTSGRITLSGEFGPDKQGRDMLTCRVSDSGIGMPPSLVERVFDPFVQGDAVTASRYGGTGLGLSICARLCALMGGGITARSVQDVGSAFTVSVPLSPVAQDATTPAPVPAVPARSGDVMVLCQDGRSGEYLEAWLTAAGWRTNVLASLAAAQEYLRFNQPGVIVATEDYSLDTLASLRDSCPATVVRVTQDGPHRPRPCAPGILEVTGFSHGTLLACVESAAARRRRRREKPHDDDDGQPPPGPDVGNETAEPGLQDAPCPAPNPRTILVAEDNPLNQTLITEQLRTLGCQPIVVSNGKQALALLESRPVDAVLTDLHMPVMDGYALLGAVRKSHPRLPVLAFSAVSRLDEGADWQRRGFSGYIAKPASLHELELGLQVIPSASAGGASPAAAPASDDSNEACHQARYEAMLREQLRTDLRSLAQALARRDFRALGAWAHRAAGAFRIVRRKDLFAQCRELEELCTSAQQWAPAIAAAGTSLHAQARHYAAEGPSTQPQTRA